MASLFFKERCSEGNNGTFFMKYSILLNINIIVTDFTKNKD